MSKRATGSNEHGGAYGRPLRVPDGPLSKVGPGTPCGELLRRYWHPVALSAKVIDRPQKVRILGEDLILFRDGKGKPGLLAPHCAHRGTSLYYGKVDEHGIRCCYHGWLFDVEGRCIDQPCEPGGGQNKGLVRQPWYPVEERYGMVFAYMGPLNKKPVLPRWRVLEDLQEGETLFVHGYTGIGVGADDTIEVIPFNWLQNWENIMDPFHVPMLHTRHRAIQYTAAAGNLPEVTFKYTDLGVNYVAHRVGSDGTKVERVSSVVFPNLVLVPDQQLDVTGPTRYVRWLVPADDENHILFHVMHVPAGMDGQAMFDLSSRPRAMGTDKPWSEAASPATPRNISFPAMWASGCCGDCSGNRSRSWKTAAIRSACLMAQRMNISTRMRATT